MNTLLQRLRGLFGGRQEENGYYDDEYGEDDDLQETPDDSERHLYTALDIGTAYAKAIIVEVHGDQAEVLGVGRHQQSYTHMSDGFVTDIPGVIATCNAALVEAEKAATASLDTYSADPADPGVASQEAMPVRVPWNESVASFSSRPPPERCSKNR